MGSASGERVDGDFVNYVNRTGSDVLKRIIGQGLSDQKVAYLREVLERREAGKKVLSVKEATKKYAESRDVADMPRKDNVMGEWSGKVEVSKKGVPDETQYFYEGRNVATTSSKGNKVWTRKAIKLGFNDRDVVIRKSGIKESSKDSSVMGGADASKDNRNYAVMDVYKPFTEKQIEEGKKINREMKWNKVKETAKDYWDRSAGLLFGAIEELTTGTYKKGKRKSEKNVYGTGGEWVNYDAPGMGGKGTIMQDYKVLSDEELLKKAPYVATDIIINRESAKLDGQARKKAEELKNKYQNELQRDVNSFSKDRKKYYANEVKKGNMNVDDANNSFIWEVNKYSDEKAIAMNRKINDEFMKVMTPKIERTKSYIEGYDKKAGRQKSRSEIASRVVGAVLIGGAMALTGGVGIALGVGQLGRTALDSKKIWTTFKRDPLKFAYEVVPQIAGGIAGYKMGVRLKGQGNVALAGKISKIPKSLEMSGIIQYLRYMKTIPIAKLRSILGPKGKVVLKARGGDLSITRTGKGILRAVRKGKNWNEQIVVGTDEVVKGVVKRTFNNWRGKPIDYYIKYKILQNGNRVTEYFKGDKRFSMIKDAVKDEYMISEELPATILKGEKSYSLLDDGTKISNIADDMDYYLGSDGKFYEKGVLDSAKSVKEKAKMDVKIQKVTGTNKKYNTKGEIVNKYLDYELTLADPIEFNKALLLAKKSGDEMTLAFLKEIKKKRSVLGKGKGINKDYVKFDDLKTILDPDGNVVKIQKIKEIKTPTLNVVKKNLKGTTFKVIQSKNPGIAMRTIDKINKALVEDAIKGGRVYIMADPVTGVLTKVKMPQLRVKSNVLRINKSFGRVMNLPKELSLEQLKYLIGLGAIDVRNLLNVLKRKENLIVKNLPVQLQNFRYAQAMRQKMQMQNKLRQVTINKMAMSDIEPNVKVPNVPVPPVKGPNIPLLILPGEAGKIKNNRRGFDAEVFKQLRYSDPLEALTGKQRYSDKMNIKLTSRYGNFYS